MVEKQRVIDVTRLFFGVTFDALEQGDETYDLKVINLLTHLKKGLINAIETMPSAQTTQTNTPNALNALDCVGRQAAIDVVRTECRCGEQMELIRELEKLPSAQPEQRWIPCSERLPEIGKEVLLSEPNVMFIAEYHGSGNSEGLWLVDGCHHYLADVNGCAWMPLPEPWRGEEP